MSVDLVMGCTVHTTLPAGVGSTSLDPAVRYVRSGRTDGMRLRAEREVVHGGRRVATAEATLTDQDGACWRRRRARA